MKTVVSAHTRVRVFFTLSLNETVRRIKTPVVHVRCDLTTHSTILSHVGILAMLSWNFTGNVLSNCRLFDYLIICLIIITIIIICLYFTRITY